MSSIIERSFAGGELGPAVYGRADLAKYQTGLRTCRNFIVRRHGGVSNRGGTEFIGEVKDSSVRTRLLPFVFNNDQTYVLEAGAGYFRIYRDGILQAPTGVAPWDSVVAYATGDLVVDGGVTYYAFQASTGMPPATSPTFWHPEPSGVYEVPTDYLEGELPQVKYVQSLDVLTLVHREAMPSELKRTLSGPDIRWRFENIIVDPPAAWTPTGGSATAGTGGAIVWRYQVTAAVAPDYEESLPSATFECTGGEPTVAAPNLLTWDAVPNALEYYVYRETVPESGVFGYIETAAQASFSDPYITPEPAATPPMARDPFPDILDKPGAVTYYQQRLGLGGSYNRPEDIELSRSGHFHNFTKTAPLQDDNAISMTLAGLTYNELRHLLVVRKQLIAMTAGGEWVITGDSDGVLKPTAASADQDTHYGASHVAPVIVGDTVIFVQARENLVRSLRFVQDRDGYAGADLTIFAPHLFEGFRIERVAFQQNPNSIVWAVRNDGVLLGLTYLPEQEIWAWHRHDTDGWFEDVCVVPEGDEDAVYLIVRRYVDGQYKRYIERMAPSRVSNIPVDAAFLDSHLVYDGRNMTSTTMRLTSVPGSWSQYDLLTLIASANYFTNADVGNSIVLQVGTEQISVRIAQNIDGISAYGFPNRTVPLAFRNVDIGPWAKGVDEFAGLDHLEGFTVGVFADGHVLPDETVVDGKITLDNTYTFVRVGLHIVADFETLDMDQGQIRDKRKNVASISAVIENTRGFWKGPDRNHLTEWRPDAPQTWRAPLEPQTVTLEVPIDSTWVNRYGESTGRFVIRHTDPLPLNINAVIPRVNVGG